MPDLAKSRRALRLLLDERDPADAVASYYAFHHPNNKTHLFTYPVGSEGAAGYLALSRTGMDLFRPLVTLRLPLTDMTASTDLIYQALVPETAVILFAPASYLPLLQATFDIQVEEHFQLFVLDRSRFKPVINVLVTQTTGPNKLPRFVIRRTGSPNQEIVASSGLNWQSPTFAEISVNTAPGHQRQGWGQSVAAAMTQYVLDSGRTPLYIVSANNTSSIRLAQHIGFIDSGIRKIMLQGFLKPHP